MWTYNISGLLFWSQRTDVCMFFFKAPKLDDVEVGRNVCCGVSVHEVGQKSGIYIMLRHLETAHEWWTK